jgi:hypothetical protein
VACPTVGGLTSLYSIRRSTYILLLLHTFARFPLLSRANSVYPTRYRRNITIISVIIFNKIITELILPRVIPVRGQVDQDHDSESIKNHGKRTLALQSGSSGNCCLELGTSLEDDRLQGACISGLRDYLGE